MTDTLNNLHEVMKPLSAIIWNEIPSEKFKEIFGGMRLLGNWQYDKYCNVVPLSEISDDKPS